MISKTIAATEINIRAGGIFGSYFDEKNVRLSAYHRCGAASLLVMLPGALMTPQLMLQVGLFDIVQQRGLALDLLVPDLHALMGCNRAALDVLEVEILAPARVRYQQVWLGGISRGGQLALSCMAERSSRVDGLCLLAPYAGSRLTTNAIRRAGGVEAWQPSTEQLSDPEFRLWRWLKHPDIEVPVFMGYGAQDRFVDGMQLLAGRLPMATHCQLPGGHDWPVWQALWVQFLDQGFFPKLP
jgi:pimeloyl-ACP methyl ester carboxylesterase